ncbi:MAG: hypothetical protein JOZ32_04805 [Bryobacterales bacterium]|nr:hypothetical protein [Bryobacterales bacterium]
MNTKEMIMNRSTIAKNFAIAAVTVLVLGIAPTAKADNKGCSNATLRGTYAYTSTGTITSPPDLAGPVAEVGTQTFDGKGSTTATATLNDTPQPLMITGTYTVNSDCTGTFTLQVVSPFQATIDVFFVLDNGGDEFQAIETNPGFVITRIGRRLFPGVGI